MSIPGPMGDPKNLENDRKIDQKSIGKIDKIDQK